MSNKKIIQELRNQIREKTKRCAEMANVIPDATDTCEEVEVDDVKPKVVKKKTVEI
jgi:predicted RNase H-related nuclease YkuK (DUF458 family)